jgi:hypothetical protein
MEYRSRWLNHAGMMSRHFEIVLHAFDREIPSSRPIRLLDVGVENGGSVEIWQDILPEGSEVLGVDIDPACGRLGLPVVVGDIRDRGWVKEAFRGRWFDVVVDSTGVMSSNVWPYLVKGGRMFFENYDPAVVSGLVRDVAHGSDGWLPVEEILKVTVYPHVAVVEKSNPRVVPYLEVMAGNFAEVVSEEDLRLMEVRQVVI